MRGLISPATWTVAWAFTSPNLCESIAGVPYLARTHGVPYRGVPYLAKTHGVWHSGIPYLARTHECPQGSPLPGVERSWTFAPRLTSPHFSHEVLTVTETWFLTLVPPWPSLLLTFFTIVHFLFHPGNKFLHSHHQSSKNKRRRGGGGVKLVHFLPPK